MQQFVAATCDLDDDGTRPLHRNCEESKRIESVGEEFEATVMTVGDDDDGKLTAPKPMLTMLLPMLLKIPSRHTHSYITNTYARQNPPQDKVDVIC